MKGKKQWVETIAYHGWGFEQSCWQPWIERFALDGHHIQAFDRGYFGEAITPSFANTPHHSVEDASKSHVNHRLLILHSFGLHLCPIETIQQADQVVIFGSFLCFHPEEPRRNRRSKQVVGKMSDRLKTHPLKLLQQFWYNCYAPTPCPIKRELRGVNLQLLHQDLERLNTTTIDEHSPLLTVLQQVSNITVIHGEADQIVPLSQGGTLADAVSAPLITVPDAGHALPFSHPDQCWALAPFTTWLRTRSRTQ